MSRSCDLTGVKAQRGRSVPVNRSQTGVRTKRTFAPNIQKVSILSDALGKVPLRLAVKTIRSIEHNGGLDQFLLTSSASKLTTKGKELRKKINAAHESKQKPVAKAAAKPAAKKPVKKSPKAEKAAAKKAAGHTKAKKKPAAKKAKSK